MNALLTYDISARHTEVKDEMKNNTYGYHDYWTSNNVTYWLPNTTLWKKDSTSAQALADIKKVIADFNRRYNWNIILERAVAVDFNTWAGIPGQGRATR